MNFAQASSVPGFSESSFASIPKQTRDIFGAGEFDASQRVVHPTKKVTQGKHIYVVDSRQRDCKVYPSPSRYRIPIDQVYKNITSIELKGCILPKTSYNVHSSNNVIDFNIGDTVTRIDVKDGGSGYTVAPNVRISDPVAGVTATATATIVGTAVTSITIGVAGSGYNSSGPPFVFIDPPPPGGAQATAVAIVGTRYQTKLRKGNYIIGGNNVPGTSVIPTGLLLEIQNAMNFAVNGGAYNPASISPFAVRLVSQYPELGAAAGTPEAAATNACPYNRIQITNVNSDPWEILWCSGKGSKNNARRLMGFNWMDDTIPTATPAINAGAGDIIPAGTTYRADFDFDLLDYPDYAILSFWAVADESFERIQSVSGDGLNRAFATMVFDANNPDNLLDLDGTTNTDVGGIDYLEGEITRGDFYRPPGTTKALKGFDFDQKYLEFSPAIGKLSYLNINFTKFGTQSGDLPNFYDFGGRDHLLIFEFSASDTMTGNRWS